MTRKKDLYLIAAIFGAALLVLLLGRAQRGKAPLMTPAEKDESSASVSAAGGYAEFVNDTVRTWFEEYPAETYLMVTVDGNEYSPIPLNGENSFRVAQEDGSENVVHIGKNSFYMEASNCDNQNCVGQGEVTLDNRDSRVLYNMVICLPHRLTLELLTPEEAAARFAEAYGGISGG